MDRSTKLKLAFCVTVPILLGAAMSGEEAESPYTRLSLSGTGYSSQTAEYVSVSAAAETFSTSASRAMSENATDMSRLRDRLGRLGVAKDDFRTANFNFQKGSDPDDNDGDRDRGFVVQHQLSIIIRNTDKSGAIMDALVDAGAKNLSVNRYWGYSQEVSPQSLKDARVRAIRDAQVKANDYAGALGLRVRRIVSINDQGGYAQDRPMPTAAMRADVGATSIETRPQTVLASVSMVFELAK